MENVTERISRVEMGLNLFGIISVRTVKIFLIVLSKYYLSTFFGSFLILVSIEGATQDSIAWTVQGIIYKGIK